MAVTLTVLEPYEDADGNEVTCGRCPMQKDIKICFTGKNNKVVVRDNAILESLTILFDCNNGYFEIGSHSRTAFKGVVRIGQDCRIVLGDLVTTTSRCYMTTAEGTSIEIGNDVMIASDVEFRADDAHPIFDVTSGKRTNMPKNIKIGHHVWIAKQVILLGGAVIDDGCVIGIRSVVKGRFHNNCIIAGSPAKAIRKNIAWERPHLTRQEPFYKPDASFVKKSDYWNLTMESSPSVIDSKESWWRSALDYWRNRFGGPNK